MKHLFLFVFGLFIFVPFTVQAEDVAVPVEVKNAYAFATAAQQKNGAVFLTLVNHDEERPATLISGHTDAAETIELHTMSMDNDMMEMRQVDSFEVPAEAALSLAPTGNHIMLMGLHAPLKIDGYFPLTLTFEQWGDVSVHVTVIAPGTSPEDSMEHTE